MQLTIDVDKNFIETLKEEFCTPHIKDALYQLLDFYKEKNKNHTTIDEQVLNRVNDYKNGCLKTSAFHDNLDEIRQNILKQI